jgi:hypothetical protein
MTPAAAALVILAWLANQALNALLHPTTTPEEGNR